MTDSAPTDVSASVANPETSEKPKLIPANENPWYLLATLHGEQPEGATWQNYDTELHKNNRNSWNIFFYLNSDKNIKNKLKSIKNKYDHPYIDNNYSPNSFDTEINRIYSLFQKRGGSKFPHGKIDLDNTLFNNYLNFDNFLIPNDITFKNSIIECDSNFSNTTFLMQAEFMSVDFIGISIFRDAQFNNSSYFEKSNFKNGVYFDRTIFNNFTSFNCILVSGNDFGLMDVHFLGNADFTNMFVENNIYMNNSIIDSHGRFNNSNICGMSDFSNVKFNSSVSFQDVYFRKSVFFMKSIFSGYTIFKNSTFQNVVLFSNVKFNNGADFKKTKFDNNVEFNNCEFSNTTDFSKIRFLTHPPKFFGAKLHEDTDWRDINWPPPPTDPEEVGNHLRAYERLKQEMERLKKHEDEHNFLCLEMQCKEVRDGPLKSIPSRLYRVFSDYGRSVARPFKGAIAVTLAGFLPLWIHYGPFQAPKAAGLSAANMLALLGFRKEFIAEEIVKALPASLKVMSAIQSGFGALFLFLIGLALRNRFRMK